jgi:hypothetical protein
MTDQPRVRVLALPVAPGPAVPTDAQWERYCQEHLQPSLLFKLAVGLSVPDAEQRSHIESCERCRTAFDTYREAGEIEMRGDREVVS